jgi:hypothetical protein
MNFSSVANDLVTMGLGVANDDAFS